MAVSIIPKKSAEPEFVDETYTCSGSISRLTYTFPSYLGRSGDNYTFGLQKDGYTAVGVVGLRVSSAQIYNSTPFTFDYSNQRVTIYDRSQSNSGRVNITAAIKYIKN